MKKKRGARVRYDASRIKGGKDPRNSGGCVSWDDRSCKPAGSVASIKYYANGLDAFLVNFDRRKGSAGYLRSSVIFSGN